MNRFSKAIITSALTACAVSGYVYGADGDNLTQCQAQVAEIYLGFEEMQFVGQRRFPDGTMMQFAIRNEDPETGYSTTRLAVCWLGADNYQAYAAQSTATTVADRQDFGSVNLDAPLAH